MAEDLALWAATLELEVIEVREGNAMLCRDLCKTTAELMRQLEEMQLHLSRLKHMKVNFNEITRLEVEKQTSIAIEDLDIRLARATRKIKQNSQILNQFQQTLVDQEDAIELLNERLLKLERNQKIQQRTRTLIN